MLVLMDFQIKSDLNGTEAAVVIQGMTDHSPIPIVFLTAHAAVEFPLLARSPVCIFEKTFFRRRSEKNSR